MDETPDKEIVEAIKRKRRRERWNAFLTPLITMALIVLSIGMLMFLIKACQERFPHSPLLKPQPENRPTN